MRFRAGGEPRKGRMKEHREKTKGRVGGWGLGRCAEREDGIDEKEAREKLVFSGDKNVNLKIRR